MTAPLSGVEICNLALGYLHERPITSIDTPSTQTEVICAAWYDQTRRATLRRHPWNFAIKRKSLPVNSTAPAFGYTKAYNLPTDFIRLVTIGNIQDDGLELNYQLEDNKILIDDTGGSSTTALPIRYIYDFTNVAQMDPLFVDVCAVELALRISYPITNSNSRAQFLKAHLKDIAPEAYAIDGQERVPHKIERSKFLRARKGHAGKRTDRHHDY